MPNQKFTDKDNLEQFGDGILNKVSAVVAAEVASQLTDVATGKYRGSYATVAALNATDFTADPPKYGDYVVVQADEDHSGAVTRYIWQQVSGVDKWAYQYTVENVPRDFSTDPITESEIDSTVTARIPASPISPLHENEVLDVLINSGFTDPFAIAIDLGEISAAVESAAYNTTKFFKFVLPTSNGYSVSVAETNALHTYTITLYDSSFGVITSSTGSISLAAYDGAYLVGVRSILTADGNVSAASFKLSIA